ncbi:MAG: right-handed parallel beta-helix repeat-containing protein, partial [Mucilaginibacter sp.]
GYVKDGTADYTTYLQAALKQYRTILMPDFPVMVNDSGLVLSSGQTLIFNTNSTLKLKASALDTYDILRIHHVENVTIYFPVIYGDKNEHLGNEGQWGMGIAIRASKNVTIVQPKIYSCWGDGIYIGQLKHIPAENIIIYEPLLDDNRRNGLSVTAVNGLTINGGVVANSNGQMPMSGIDIEPNFADDVIDNISINNTVTYNHPKYGIVVSLQKLAGRKQGASNIKIDGHTDEYSGNALAIIGKPNEAVLTGSINVANSVWLNNKLGGLKLPVRNYGIPVRLVKNAYGSDKETEKVISALKKQVNITLSQ